MPTPNIKGKTYLVIYDTIFFKIRKIQILIVNLHNAKIILFSKKYTFLRVDFENIVNR